MIAAFKVALKRLNELSLWAIEPSLAYPAVRSFVQLSERVIDRRIMLPRYLRFSEETVNPRTFYSSEMDIFAGTNTYKLDNSASKNVIRVMKKLYNSGCTLTVVS
ncbi:hypothetical protein AVEN_228604-1 [Araneus ventricosus]|uniref:Uncharacterized protein n=1 Tax=Araneus ventricosus TaxID=182803 RepID=A0A4Y2KJ58_ARAVE|nr:hypothetical protein AVEN_228604-1 [Araneus ventricosus]